MKSTRPKIYRLPFKPVAKVRLPSRPATHPHSFIRFEKPRIVGEFRKLLSDLEQRKSGDGE